MRKLVLLWGIKKTEAEIYSSAFKIHCSRWSSLQANHEREKTEHNQVPVLNNLINNGIVKEKEKNLMFDYGAFESKYKEKVQYDSLEFKVELET